MISRIVRLILSSEMEVLRGPLLFALCLAAFVHFWKRWRYTGMLPRDRGSWKELLCRTSSAIAITYSVIGMFRQAISEPRKVDPVV